MSATTTTLRLPVPGATLHYEVRGAGPVLLMICGGIYDAAGFAALATDLADRYTVVTYDRRGNSRSPLDGPRVRVDVATHADDAARLLREVGVTAEAPAAVFGNSSGAIVGLELAAAHPELVHTLVAHEPPVFELLPDPARWRALRMDVERAYERDSISAALETFGAGLAEGAGPQPSDGHGHDDADSAAGHGAAPDAETLAMMDRMQLNLDVFAGFEIPVFMAYRPDVEALRAAGTRIVPGAGDASVGEVPHRAAYAVGAALGVVTVRFPGDHGGFGPEHERFAARLHETLVAGA